MLRDNISTQPRAPTHERLTLYSSDLFIDHCCQTPTKSLWNTFSHFPALTRLAYVSRRFRRRVRYRLPAASLDDQAAVKHCEQDESANLFSFDNQCFLLIKMLGVAPKTLIVSSLANLNNSCLDGHLDELQDLRIEMPVSLDDITPVFRKLNLSKIKVLGLNLRGVTAEQSRDFLTSIPTELLDLDRLELRIGAQVDDLSFLKNCKAREVHLECFGESESPIWDRNDLYNINYRKLRALLRRANAFLGSVTTVSVKWLPPETPSCNGLMKPFIDHDSYYWWRLMFPGLTRVKVECESILPNPRSNLLDRAGYFMDFNPMLNPTVHLEVTCRDAPIAPKIFEKCIDILKRQFTNVQSNTVITPDPWKRGHHITRYLVTCSVDSLTCNIDFAFSSQVKP